MAVDRVGYAWFRANRGALIKPDAEREERPLYLLERPTIYAMCSNNHRRPISVAYLEETVRKVRAGMPAPKVTT